MGLLSSYLYSLMAAFEMEKSDHLWRILLFLDIYYVLRIIKMFITDFMPLGEANPQRNLLKIAKRYLKNEFAIDFIMWFPTQWLVLYVEPRLRYLLLIKAYRIKQSMDQLNVHNIMHNIKHRLQVQSEKRSKEDLAYGEDQLHDHNNIINMLYWEYILKTMKLSLTIWNFAFMLAIAWSIYCEATINILIDDPRYDPSLGFD